MIYLKDCLEGMKELDDRSVSAIVTSPPYNLNINYGRYSDNKPRQEYLSWLVDIFREAKRVLEDAKRIKHTWAWLRYLWFV